MAEYVAQDGKRYEVVAVREPKAGEMYIAPLSGVLVAGLDRKGDWPIVRLITPEWITPTDEHARERPMVEVRDYDSQLWRTQKLLAVVPHNYAFVTMGDDGDYDNWQQCRMRNPEYQPPAG